MIGIPAVLLGALELCLRLFGYGYPTSFFVKTDDGLNYTANRSFGFQFFPRETATYPHPLLMPAHKPHGTRRIFILGESAALGTPAPPFGFGRILEVMLRQQFPNQRFEVINAAMRGIDSNIILPIAEECAGHQPDLFIVYAGNNEAIGLYAPNPGSRNFTSRRLILQAGQTLKAAKVFQLLEALLPKPKKNDDSKKQDMEFFRSHHFPADAPGREVIYTNFLANLDEICRIVHRSGAKAVVSTVGVNLKDFPPLGSLHRAGLTASDTARWDAALASGIAAETAGNHAQAVTNYLEAVRLDDHFAELHFRLGRCYLAQEQFEPARAHYQLSRDWDALQFRTDTRRNRDIRDVASRWQGQGISLVDAEAAFAASPLSDHQIPGAPIFNDHVHLSFDGDYLLAQALFPAVASSLALTPHESRITNASAPLTNHASRLTSPASLPTRAECAEKLAFTSWEEVNVGIGMVRSMENPPFLDQLEHRQRQSSALPPLQQRLSALSQPEQLDQAAAIYRAAIARDPGDWQLHYTFANFLSERRDYAGAVEQLSTVVSIFPKLQPMRLALATALVNAGKVNEGVAHLSEILRLDPRYAPAHATLARIQAQSDPFRQAPRSR